MDAVERLAERLAAEEARASSLTRSAPTNAASSSSGGIASSRPPRHSANSGQRSTS